MIQFIKSTLNSFVKYTYFFIENVKFLIWLFFFFKNWIHQNNKRFHLISKFAKCFSIYSFKSKCSFHFFFNFHFFTFSFSINHFDLFDNFHFFIETFFFNSCNSFVIAYRFRIWLFNDDDEFFDFKNFFFCLIKSIFLISFFRWRFVVVFVKTRSNVEI